ncbi:hypothetical protein HPP92_028962 [Vanilla planifolia]|uniref:Uncharacterized protein n=1 Tax=Vanilla planifolia TaxID=51239 RepID=A0A835P5P5_VANPL|nr:hypothetical protein HPP92_028962 [Vanilla planifolia]KAG0446198.1 hypothetical protein HPP92_028951 [Vanilla planifolia]
MKRIALISQPAAASLSLSSTLPLQIPSTEVSRYFGRSSSGCSSWSRSEAGKLGRKTQTAGGSRTFDHQDLDLWIQSRNWQCLKWEEDRQLLVLRGVRDRNLLAWRSVVQHGTRGRGVTPIDSTRHAEYARQPGIDFISTVAWTSSSGEPWLYGGCIDPRRYFGTLTDLPSSEVRARDS